MILAWVYRAVAAWVLRRLLRWVRSPQGRRALQRALNRVRGRR